MPAQPLDPEAAWLVWTNNGSTVTGTIATNDPVVLNAWQLWWTNITYSTQQPAHDTYSTQQPAYDPEHEERLERHRQENERRLAERQERHNAAKQRARALLQHVLDAEQWRSYEATQSFRVVGSDGETYRIRHGTVGNVYTLYPNGSVKVAYCAHPDEYDHENNCRLPTEDILVAQVLALRTDAPGFRAVANVHARWDENGNRLYDDW